MFINAANFKKLCKKAYEGIGLKVACTENEEYIIACDWWQLKVHRDDITKKVVAAVAEIVGMLPESGAAVLYKKRCGEPEHRQRIPGSDRSLGKNGSVHTRQCDYQDSGYTIPHLNWTRRKHFNSRDDFTGN